MEDNSWIKIHRRLLKNPIFEKPAYLSVWLYLLLSAQYEESSFIWNSKRHVLKKGQLLTGLKKISKKTRVAEGTVYRILKYLENEKQIEQQKTTKFTIITITNWDKYQSKEKQDEKQMKNRWKTDEKQMETYKKAKKERKIRNISKDIFGEPVKSKEFLENNQVNILQTKLKEVYPLSLNGITDRNILHNLIQIATPRKNNDEWMDRKWNINFGNFLSTYIGDTEEKYLVRSVGALKEKLKLWREYRGKLN